MSRSALARRGGRRTGEAEAHRLTPAEREGFAAVETSRGRLGHWTRLSPGGKIEDYAIVAPTEWIFIPPALSSPPCSARGCPGRPRRRRSPGSPACSTPACCIASKSRSRLMHEMAFTQSLVELIEDEGREQALSRVRVVGWRLARWEASSRRRCAFLRGRGARRHCRGRSSRYRRGSRRG